MQKLQQAIALEGSKIEPIFNVSAVYNISQQPTSEFEMLNFVAKVPTPPTPLFPHPLCPLALFRFSLYI
jgi:hypothetical protein